MADKKDKKAKIASIDDISQPHDRFFRMAMREEKVAREFFEMWLPHDLRERVNLDNLRAEPGSYVDDFLRESITDALFSTTIEGHKAYLYTIVDHQSQPDILMPLRILKYTVNIIDKHVKENKVKQIPLVFPLVVYNGRAKWAYSTDIRDLIDAPKAAIDKYFLKPFGLIDLYRIDDAVLQQRVWCGAMMLTLKRIYEQEIKPYLPDILSLYVEVNKEGGVTFTEVGLAYILRNAELNDKDAFLKLVQTEFAGEVGDKIMTIAEQLRAEGKQKGLEEGLEKGIEEGIEKGRREGKIEMIKSLLANSPNPDLEFIAHISGLSVAEVKKLKEAL